jgi:hypothetical protein
MKNTPLHKKITNFQARFKKKHSSFWYLQSKSANFKPILIKHQTNLQIKHFLSIWVTNSTTISHIRTQKKKSTQTVNKRS